MNCISILGCRPPNTSNCACSFNEFREDIELGELTGVNSRSFSDTLDFLVVSLVGVFFCDHNVEIENGSETELSGAFEFLCKELGDFGFHPLLNSTKVVLIKQVQQIFELFLKELSVGLAHLKGSAF